MAYETLLDVVRAVNDRSKDRPFGRLQDLRKDVKGMQRKALSVPFREKDMEPDWIHHFGGRTELQFNLGYDRDDEGARVLRRGLAFSIETSQTVHDPFEQLDPYIAHFNAFVREHGHRHSGLRVWVWTKEGRSPSRPLGQLTPEECSLGSFVFIGTVGPATPSEAELDDLLDDLDALMPVYESVLRGVMDDKREEEEQVPPESEKALLSPGKRSTSFQQKPRLIEVELRHRQVQERLVAALHADSEVVELDSERRASSGGAIDVWARRADGTVALYEVKTGSTSRRCIREAMGQLLEYALWPGSADFDELVVVGDRPLSVAASQWLGAMETRFGMPVRYQRA